MPEGRNLKACVTYAFSDSAPSTGDGRRGPATGAESAWESMVPRGVTPAIPRSARPYNGMKYKNGTSDRPPAFLSNWSYNRTINRIRRVPEGGQ
jgi:hypothetical protein